MLINIRILRLWELQSSLSECQEVVVIETGRLLAHLSDRENKKNIFCQKWHGDLMTVLFLLSIDCLVLKASEKIINCFCNNLKLLNIFDANECFLGFSATVRTLIHEN